jgi:hypothetical protein
MSDIVGFAQDVAIVVNGMTGLVGGRAYTPALFLGIMFSSVFHELDRTLL